MTRRSCRTWTYHSGSIIVALAVFLTAGAAGLSQSCECESFALPDELGPNFGLAWDNPFTQELPSPKYRISNFSVSPDGRWLIYLAGWHEEPSITLLRNLESGQTSVLPFASLSFQWDPSSTWVKIHRLGAKGFHFYNPETDSLQVAFTNGYCDSTGACFPFLRWGPDGHFYGDCSGLQRIRMDSSEQAGCIYFESVDSRGSTPFFPPNTVEWCVNYFYDWELPGIEQESDTITGFAVVRDLDWSTKVLRPVYLSRFGSVDRWEYADYNAWKVTEQSSPFFSMDVSACGAVYMFLGFRDRGERLDRHAPFTPAEREARGRSGWYRFDTSGGGGVQLARSWSNLGISATADGTRILYGLINPDSTMAIWEMDECGRNKRQIVGWNDHPENAGAYPWSASTPQHASLRYDASEHSIDVFDARDIRRLELYDLTGRLIRSLDKNESIHLNDSTFRFPVPPVPSGFYGIRIVGKEGIVGGDVIPMGNP